VPCVSGAEAGEEREVPASEGKIFGQGRSRGVAGGADLPEKPHDRAKVAGAGLDAVSRLRGGDRLQRHAPPFLQESAYGRGIGGIEAGNRFQAQRQARLRALLEGGPLDAWALCRALFPAARPADAFLTVSETVGNLEVLEAAGEVLREERGGGWRWVLAAP